MNTHIVYADLHTHTTASDGTLTPTQIVEKSGEIGLAVIAITDHDTLAGIDEALIAAKKNNLKVVPGIEISCGWQDNDHSIHVLGLFVDHQNPELLRILEEQKKSRFLRAHKILSLLEKEGIDISKIKEEFNADTTKVLGRPHIARFLVENAYVNDFQEAFTKYLLKGCPAYVTKEKIPPEVGIQLIQEAGGMAVLAHPGLILDWPKIWSRIEHLPWDGMEVFYSEHSPEQINMFLNIVTEKKMLATGGSDYHGDYGKHLDRLGTAGLNQQQFEQLIAKQTSENNFSMIATYSSPTYSGRLATELLEQFRKGNVQVAISERRTYLYTPDFFLKESVREFIDIPDLATKRLWISTLHELPEEPIKDDLYAIIAFCPYSVDSQQMMKLKNAKKVWVPSQSHLEVCIKHGLKKEKLAVLPILPPEGITKTNFVCPSKYAKLKDTFRFMIAAHPANRKGIEEALYSYLKAFKPNEKVELVIKLTHYPNLKKNLSFEIANLKKKLGALNKMFAKVTIINEIMDDADYFGLLSSADAYVYAAKTNNSGLSIKEAIACGIPIITHEKPAEILGLDISQCLIVPSQEADAEEKHLYAFSNKNKVWEIDKEALTKAMRFAYENKPELKIKAQKAFESQVAKTGWQELADEIMKTMFKNNAY